MSGRKCVLFGLSIQIVFLKTVTVQKIIKKEKRLTITKKVQTVMNIYIKVNI